MMATNGSNGAGNSIDTPRTDPAVYDNFESDWGSVPLPSERRRMGSTRSRCRRGLAKHGQDRSSLSARQRGELAEDVAAVKVVTTETGLCLTAGIFEITGAKATAEKVGLYCFWRDIRIHALHDPVAYKNRELGQFQLMDEVPEAT